VTVTVWVSETATPQALTAVTMIVWVPAKVQARAAVQLHADPSHERVFLAVVGGVGPDHQDVTLMAHS
jgi:hypothetical protein